MVGKPDAVVALTGRASATALTSELLSRPLHRHLTWASVADAIRAGTFSTCLVAADPTMTSTHVAQLVDASVASGTSIGFIAGWGGEEASLRHVRKLAGYEWRSARPEALLWSVFGHWRLRPGDYGATTVVHAAARGLPAVLRQPRTFAALSSHGNGVDAFLGGAYLCALAGRPRLEADVAFLPCGDSMPCLRARRAAGRPSEPDRIAVGEIAADVVMLATCQGLLCADSATSPGLSLGQLLSEAPRPGAVLTTYRHTRVIGYLAVLAWHLLRTGRSLGHVVLALNRSLQGPSTRSYPWILLGDPLARPVPSPDGSVVDGAAIGGEVALQLRRDESRYLELPAGGTWTLVSPADGRVDPRSTYAEATLDGRGILLHHVGDEPVDLALRPCEDSGARHARSELMAIGAAERDLVFVRHLIDARRCAGRRDNVRAEPDELETEVVRRLFISPPDMTPHETPSALVSAARLTSLRRLERASWERLCGDVLDFLVEDRDSREAWSPIDLFGPQAQRVASASGPRRCPYCGSAGVQTVYRVVGVERRSCWCDQCGALGDVPGALSQPVLKGPAVVRAGSEASYDLACAIDGPAAPLYGTGLLILCVPNWHEHVTGQRARTTGPAVETALTMRLSLPYETASGVYELGCFAVLDGRPCLLRRWIRVTRHATAR